MTPRRIVVENPMELGVTNLHGLNSEKLSAVIKQKKHKAVELRIDPRNGNYLLLDGNHTAAVCALKRVKLEGIIYECESEIENPVARLNFDRAMGLNDTATIRGIGSIREAIVEYNNR